VIDVVGVADAVHEVDVVHAAYSYDSLSFQLVVLRGHFLGQIGWDSMNLQLVRMVEM